MGAMVNPLSREMHYQANSVGPDIVPDLPALLGLYYAGRITGGDVIKLAGYLGVTLNNNTSLTPKAWFEAMNLARPQFDLADYQKWWRQGRINLGKADDVLARKGFTQSTGSGAEMLLWLQDRESVPYWLAIGMYLHGDLNQPQYHAVMRENGFTPGQADEMAKSARLTPSLVEVITLWNRGVIDDDEADRSLFRAGFINDDDRQRLKDLRKAIPPPSDLITFSVKEVWDTNTVNRFGYDLEFPPAFAYWMGKHGYNWGEPVAGPPGQGAVNITWAQAYWRAHWYTISPTEAFQMYHRFRGDPANPATWSRPGTPPFTIDDVRGILKIHDYPPGLRDQMLALSHQTMRLIDIRNVYRFRLRDEQWALGKFLDRGATFDDAVVQVQLIDEAERQKVKNRQLQRHRAEQQTMARELLDQFKLGILDEADTQNGLVEMGWLLPTAMLATRRVQMEDNSDTIKAVMRRGRQDYMAGRASREEAGSRLFRSGLPAAAVEKHLARWEIERGSGRIAFSTSKIIDLVKRGLLNVAEAKNYLRNLGWHDVDQVLLLAAAWQDIVKLMAQQMEAADRKRKARERELAALARASQVQTEKLQAIARRMTPLSWIKTELKKGTIGKKYYLERMISMGYDDPFIAQIYFEIFGEDINAPGNECGTYDPACGTSGTAGTEEEEEALQEDEGGGDDAARVLP